MKTAEHKQYLARRRTAHHQALATLHAMPDKANGLKMWRELRKLESFTHDATTAQCNGTTYNGQPFREDSEWQAFATTIKDRVEAIFGGNLLRGFFINGDARGYALKINPERCTIPTGMETDMGGYGLLAPEIND